jgi:hypothetical protein
MVSISELRADLQARLAKFLWNEWSQIGILAPPSQYSPWAADPEALLLMSVEVGREEPRLLDEVLDWLMVNERLVSVQRLRNLARDDFDRALVEALIGWLGEGRKRPRLGAKPKAPGPEEPQPFFRNSDLPVEDPNPAFLAQGFAKPSTPASWKSQAPDLNQPINFAFRLRLLLGIGVRAEAVRILLTTQAPRVDVKTLAASTGYTKRNVQEGVSALTAAGVLNSWEVGNEQRFEAPRESWSRFLVLEQLPQHVDWPQIFYAYRKLLRWLADPANQDLSDYMLASEARNLVEEINPDLLLAGVAIDPGGQSTDSAYLERFAERVRSLGPI